MEIVLPLLLIIIVVCLFAFVGVLASHRGYNVALFIIISIFLTPLITSLILLVLPNKEGEPPVQTIIIRENISREENTQVNPYPCHNGTSSDVNLYDISSVVKEVQDSHNFTFCSQCGAKISASSLFCNQCGHSVQE